MRQTCITLAISTLIPITASASGLTYSESRLSYQSQESNSNTARRANLNLGFEAGANQYGLRYIHRSSDNNPSSQEANITFGSHVADRLFVEGMVSAEKGDTYDNRGYGFRTEDTGFAPNMIRHWQDWCISSHMGRRREKYENLLHFRHAPWAVQRRNPLPKSHACKN